MTDRVANRCQTLVPGLRYEDASAAIEWLCEAFGFEATLVVPGEEEGTIAHAQLAIGNGNGMIMLGSRGQHPGTAFDEAMRAPSEVGGHCTQAVYVIISDADAIHARAVAAGAEILLELVDQDYGGRGFTCRDPQGHVWSFGTYDPWAEA